MKWFRVLARFTKRRQLSLVALALLLLFPVVASAAQDRTYRAPERNVAPPRRPHVLDLLASPLENSRQGLDEDFGPMRLARFLIMPEAHSAFDRSALDLSPGSTEYGYQGREKDSESGLQHFRARSYDPMTGRFTSRDSMPDSNLYYFVANDPVNKTDPSGSDYIDDSNGMATWVHERDNLWKTDRGRTPIGRIQGDKVALSSEFGGGTISLASLKGLADAHANSGDWEWNAQHGSIGLALGGWVSPNDIGQWGYLWKGEKRAVAGTASLTVNTATFGGSDFFELTNSDAYQGDGFGGSRVILIVTRETMILVASGGTSSMARGGVAGAQLAVKGLQGFEALRGGFAIGNGFRRISAGDAWGALEAAGGAFGVFGAVNQAASVFGKLGRSGSEASWGQRYINWWHEGEAANAAERTGLTWFQREISKIGVSKANNAIIGNFREDAKFAWIMSRPLGERAVIFLTSPYHAAGILTTGPSPMSRTLLTSGFKFVSGALKLERGDKK